MAGNNNNPHNHRWFIPELPIGLGFFGLGWVNPTQLGLCWVGFKLFVEVGFGLTQLENDWVWVGLGSVAISVGLWLGFKKNP